MSLIFLEGKNEINVKVKYIVLFVLFLAFHTVVAFHT